MLLNPFLRKTHHDRILPEEVESSFRLIITKRSMTVAITIVASVQTRFDVVEEHHQISVMDVILVMANVQILHTFIEQHS